MITRIEIDGFKSFRDFSVDFRPFQVFIGPNGGGKSNLFDAILLLAKFAGDNTLHEACRQCRGNLKELFTVLPDGSAVQHMRFAVEMLIAPQVTDTFGASAKVSSTRLRYELALELHSEDGFDRLDIVHESLIPLAEKQDPWFRPNVPSRSRKAWIIRRRREPYISTSEDDGYIFLHQDRRSGGKHETPLRNRDRTLLNGVNSVEYPTAYAARQEMSGWRLLSLVPSALRESSRSDCPKTLREDGSNLAAVLYRISQTAETALADVSKDLADIVPDISEITVDRLVEHEGFLIRAKTEHGPRLSSQLMPDGALRVLALIALSNDPCHRGVICLEEPENGVYPAQLLKLVKVLRQLASDFDLGPPLACRQVLINTHSPTLPAYLNAQDLLFVHMPAAQPPYTRANRVVSQIPLFPSHDPDQDTLDRDYTIHEILKQLAPASLRAHDSGVGEDV